MNDTKNTKEELKVLLNGNTCLNEKNVLKFKELLLKYGRENFKVDLNRDFLINLDERNINRDLKRKRIVYLLNRCSFKIIKRQKSFLRKRIIRRVFDTLKDYRIKTFWIIQLNQNERK